MKIDSSLIAFQSDSQKNSSSAFGRTELRSQDTLVLDPQGRNAIPLISSSTVDLSYTARMQASHNSSSQSLSTVTHGDDIQTHQRNTNLSSIVSTVLGKAAHVDKSVAMGMPGLRVEIEGSANSSERLNQAITQIPVPIQAYNAVGATLNTNATNTNATNTAALNTESLIDLTTINRAPLELSAGSANDLSQALRGITINEIEQTRVELHETHLFKETEQMRFASQGTLTTEDGRSINFMLELNMARDFELEETLSIERGERRLIDPLVINLQGGSAQLTSSSFSFDLDADGNEEEISFVGGGSGFLALDTNNDGQINDGSELFGTQGLNGFADLARHDSDGNRWIDENDAIFNELKVWTRDEAGNDQLTGLKDAGVGAIYLGSSTSTFDLTDSENNLLGSIKRSGVFLSEAGQVASIQELDLAIHGSPEGADIQASQSQGQRVLEEKYDTMLTAAEQAEVPSIEVRMTSDLNSPDEQMSIPTPVDFVMPPAIGSRAVSVEAGARVSQQARFHEQSSMTLTSEKTLSKEEKEAAAIEAFKRTFVFNENKVDLFARLRDQTDQQSLAMESSLNVMKQTIELMRKAQETALEQSANHNASSNFSSSNAI
ncbi:MAG: hypothetical protein OIF57_00080 [Marinobacterium sp.]|nr:hypothetical protein [Marinobacterium sp.]